MKMLMKHLAVLPALVIGTSLEGYEDGRADSSTRQGPGWTDEIIQFEQTACEESFKRSSPAYLSDGAKLYCRCVFKEITSRWSRAELSERSDSIIEILAREGVIPRCQLAAASDSGHSAAKAAVSQEAKAHGMPDGFLGVSLTTNLSELMTIRPSIRRSGNGWEEVAEWNGAPFRIIYELDDNGKMVVMILLQRPSNLASYRAIQARLDKDFGPFPDASPTEGMLLHSERSGGGVRLAHRLAELADGTLVEQVILHKLK